jgi:hypothetical protein
MRSRKTRTHAWGNCKDLHWYGTWPYSAGARDAATSVTPP